MKTRRILLIGLSVLVGLILLLGLSMWVWSATRTYPSGQAAEVALTSSPTLSITRDQRIIFQPEDSPKTGLIFYPGGLVEPEAYAPVLRDIAKQGVLVIITPMPLNLAIFNPGAADKVMAAYPGITTWYLAGHSLGGAAAAIYAEDHSDQLAGLALWDSYPPSSSDLSANNLAILSIYGTTKGFPNPENFDDTRTLLPVDTIYLPIEGASHAQFGDYGPQKGDVIPSMSAEDQQQIVLDAMIEFIK